MLQYPNAISTSQIVSFIMYSTLDMIHSLLHNTVKLVLTEPWINQNPV